MNNYTKRMLQDEELYLVPIQDYIKILDEKYKTLSSWLTVISPPQKAEELYALVNGRYSKIWHCHCENCWQTFTDASQDSIYISKDGLTILCQDCFEKLQQKSKCKEIYPKGYDGKDIN